VAGPARTLARANADADARARAYDGAVGQKTATATIAAIVQAFLERRTWTQADLSRRLVIGVPAVRRRLGELLDGGMPLTQEKDHPHVYWSVPKSWFPGGVLYAAEDVRALFRQLGRLPRGKERDRLLGTALSCVPGVLPPSRAIVARQETGAEERFLSVVEDAAQRGLALRFRYFTASRGKDSLRWASVHRLLVGPPARFLATCHKSDELKWFRLDNVFDAAVDVNEPFRPAEAAGVDALLAGSLDGFYDKSTTPRPHAFFVRDPEARWVVKSLLDGMRASDVPGGVRVEANTTAVVRLARYVVGLGEAGRAETAELRAAVLALAEGVLRANGTDKVATGRKAADKRAKARKRG
jgi:predicted DNA-binding transcriptional regulator YafY